jgi:putative restriction endonuclease
MARPLSCFSFYRQEYTRPSDYWACQYGENRTVTPVLDAAHIKPYKLIQKHEVSNGLLMRSDLHRLFDDGYLTIDPLERRVVVSKRIKEEFENGRDYYGLEGTRIRKPNEPWAKPGADNLEYHAHEVFR